MKPLAWKEESDEEYYENHIESILSLWENKFKNIYLKTVSRIMETKPDETDKLIKIMIILHDTGKLFIKYQNFLRSQEQDPNFNRYEYRHEIISAALTDIAMREHHKVHIIGGAIFLHHEPILMGQVKKIGEPYLTLTEIERRLRKHCGEEITLDEEGIKFTNTLLSKHLLRSNLPANLPIRVKTDDILNLLKNILLKLIVKCSHEKRTKIRLEVATLIFLLNVMDSVAANKNREKTDKGGTFITKRAKRAEISLAEVI